MRTKRKAIAIINRNHAVISSAHAAPYLRLQARQRRRRHPSAAALHGPSQHHAHGARYTELSSDRFDGFWKDLSLGPSNKPDFTVKAVAGWPSSPIRVCHGPSIASCLSLLKTSPTAGTVVVSAQ